MRQRRAMEKSQIISDNAAKHKSIFTLGHLLHLRHRGVLKYSVQRAYLFEGSAYKWYWLMNGSMMTGIGHPMLLFEVDVTGECDRLTK